MQITREREIEIEGKKEKVRVSFDIPDSLFKTKEELEVECGNEEIGNEAPEQILDETFGAVCNSIALYLASSFRCGHSGEALLMLQSSILISGEALGKMVRVWKEQDEGMS